MAWCSVITEQGIYERPQNCMNEFSSQLCQSGSLCVLHWDFEDAWAHCFYSWKVKLNDTTTNTCHSSVGVCCAPVYRNARFIRARLSLALSLSFSLFLPQHNSLNRVSCDFRWLSMHSDAIHCLVVVVVLLILYPFCCFTVRTLYEWNIYDLFFSCCFLLLLSPLVFNSFIRSRALKLSIILMNEIIIIEWLKATTALSNCKW